MHVARPQAKARPGTWCFPQYLLGKGLLPASRQAAGVTEPAPAARWALQQCLPLFFCIMCCGPAKAGRAAGFSQKAGCSVTALHQGCLWGRGSDARLVLKVAFVPWLKNAAVGVFSAAIAPPVYLQRSCTLTGLALLPTLAKIKCSAIFCVALDCLNWMTLSDAVRSHPCAG